MVSPLGTPDERDKMLRGAPYDASDPLLVEARFRARRLAQRLGALDPADEQGQDALLRELLGGLGPGAMVVPPFWCDYGSNIRLGSRVFVNFSCVFLDAAPVTVGDDVQFGPLVQLLTSDHPRDSRERAAGLETARPIVIGPRSWLGGGVIVLPGVEIGSDVTVGAGSVVTHSLPSGTTAAGNPCRIVSKVASPRRDRRKGSNLTRFARRSSLTRWVDRRAGRTAGVA